MRWLIGVPRIVVLAMGLLLSSVVAPPELPHARGADKPAAKARVSIELVTEKGIPLTASQQWNQVFSQLGVNNLRIRSAIVGDTVGIENRGTKEAPVYDVVGLIKADNTLHLPGGKFTLSDGPRLKKWLADLGEQGTEAVTQPRQVFGLTRSQLIEVDDDLKKPVSFVTSEMSAAKAVEQLGRGLQSAIEIDPAGQRALAEAKVAEDLAGISSGTALAAILRPAGLVFTPERAAAGGGAMRYRVAKPAAGRESWPIGWKPTVPEAKLMPEMYGKMINVEIEPLPVAEAVAGIQEQIKIPVLWDHNALALHGIDPTKLEVKLAPKKLTLSLILQRVLSQAKLKKELRIDEAGRPFLWITTVKPS